MATATPEPRSRDLKAHLDTATIPPLVDGDRLDAVEFDRRYEAAPHIKKAELIEGVVHVASPVRITQHGMPHAIILGWLTQYVAGTPGLIFGDNSTVRLDGRNVYQPDAVLFIDPDHGGQVRLNDGYIEGGPELVIEIAASTTAIDLHEKRDCYLRHGVREYVVWRVLDNAIDWFTLQNGQYEPATTTADGIFRSEVFPGLWLDAKALLAADLARVLAVVGEGVQSPEQAAFLARIGEKPAS